MEPKLISLDKKVKKLIYMIFIVNKIYNVNKIYLFNLVINYLIIKKIN